MRGISEYSVGPNGVLWVRTNNGETRRATEREWLTLWIRDPRLTLRLAR